MSQVSAFRRFAIADRFQAVSTVPRETDVNPLALHLRLLLLLVLGLLRLGTQGHRPHERGPVDDQLAGRQVALSISPPVRVLAKAVVHELCEDPRPVVQAARLFLAVLGLLEETFQV